MQQIDRYPVFHFRLSHDDRQKLADLASRAGTSRGDVMKRLLRSATPEQVTKEEVGNGAVVSEAASTTPKVVR